MARRKQRGQPPRPTAAGPAGQAATAPAAVPAGPSAVGQWTGRAIPFLAIGLFLMGLVQLGWIAEPTKYVGAALALVLACLALAVVRPALNWQDWRVWVLLLNAAGYAVAVPFSADRFQAAVGVALACIGLLVFLAGVSMGRQPGAMVRLNVGAALAMAAVCWLALATYFGFVPFPATAVAGRLSGTLQYANVMGALGLAAAVAAVGLRASEAWLTWRHAAAYGGWLCLLLSQSRGALFLAPLIMIGLALYTYRRWPRALVFLLYHLFAAGAAAAYLIPRVNPQAEAYPQFQSFFLLSAAATVAVGFALEWVLRRPFAGDRISRGLVLTATAAGLAGGALLLPRVLPRLARVTDTSTTVRIQHLMDSVNQFIHLPLGVGYLGWQDTQHQFQSWGYSINILHSWLAETAVAAGALGLIGLIGLWCAFVLNYRDAGRRSGDQGDLAVHATFWATAGFGLHGLLVDANFGFVLLNLSVFLILGVYHGAAHGPGPRSRRTPARTPLWVWPAGAVVGLFLATAAVGYTHYSRSLDLARAGNGEESLAAARLASRWSPLDPRPRSQAGVIQLEQWQQKRGGPELLEEAGADLRAALALQPRQADRHREYARYLSATGELPAAEQHFARAVVLAPWRIVNWEDLLTFYVRAVDALTQAGQAEAAAVYRARARAAEQDLDERIARQPAHTKSLSYTPILKELEELTQAWPEP